MKILIPIDVWQEEVNTHLACDLARMLPMTKAEIVLLYAMQAEPHIETAALVSAAQRTKGTRADTEPAIAASQYGPDYFCNELEKKAKSHLESVAEELKSSCLSVETLFEHGPPAKIIESVAKTKAADLTVIRGAPAGLLESVFLGNTVTQVIKHSTNAVMVLRSGPVLESLNKVIIALDGSEQAKTALKNFCNLYKERPQEIEVTLAHVVSIPGPWRFISPVEFVASLEDNLDMAGKAILAEGEAILLESGWKPKIMPVPMIVRTGDAATELDRLAGEIEAGLIVLGAQGKTAVHNFLLGGVSEALALKSNFPILVFQ